MTRETIDDKIAKIGVLKWMWTMTDFLVELPETLIKHIKKEVGEK